jgi:hypothetical protein
MRKGGGEPPHSKGAVPGENTANPSSFRKAATETQRTPRGE